MMIATLLITMMRPIQNRRLPGPSEDGYILIAVMFMLALLIIAMAVALPKVLADIQRDREVETMHRGKQYTRAIQLYYRKFGRYPPNLDALVKTNEIRFLRKKYVDPTTGKNEWKPILAGQNKTPMAMGFFGQPLGGVGFGGAALAGMGPGGGNGIAGATTPQGGIGSSGFGSSGGIGSSGSSIFSSSNAGTNAGTGTTGTGTTGTGTTGTDGSGGTDANGNPIDPGTGSSPIGGQTFGGGGLIGVSPTSPKQSILVYKKKNHYNEWEFLYSPLSDQMTMQGGNPGIVNQPGVGAPGTGGTSPSSVAPGSGTQAPTPTPQ
jgi:type II secretory pathway pseudopilin PulG